jgi:TatA/E family protein of Tat protein translocase
MVKAVGHSGPRLNELGTFVIVLLIVLLLFSDRLADAGKGLGEAVKNFKRAVKTDGPSGVPTVSVVPPGAAPPKLLPAKGETTPGSGESNERKA